MLLPLHLNGLNLDSATVVASITGTVGNGALESEIVNDGGTIIVTLTNDTWVAAGATFNAQRQNIIDGLDSAQAEATGWNTLIRDVIGVTTVVRTSDTVVTITIPATSGYVIGEDEVITVTVPATALVTSAGAITGTPTITVSSEAAASDGAGRSRRRSRRTRRLVVDIDNQHFEVSSVQEAQELLRQAKELAERKASTDIKRQAIQVKPGDPVPIVLPEISTTSKSLKPLVAEFQRDIENIYQRIARDNEIRTLVARRQEADQEEEAVISLLFH